MGRDAIDNSRKCRQRSKKFVTMTTLLIALH